MGYINAGLDGIIIAFSLFFSIFLIVMIPAEIIDHIVSKRRIRKIKRRYENK